MIDLKRVRSITGMELSVYLLLAYVAGAAFSWFGLLIMVIIALVWVLIQERKSHTVYPRN